MSKPVNPMFATPPKVIVNEYKSLDDELGAIVAGAWKEGVQSKDYIIDIYEDAKERVVPLGVQAIKRAFEKWGKL